MNPIEKLNAEHRNILRGIELLENGINRLENGEKIPAEFFRKMIDFIRDYADKYHHAKEEDILFVKMEHAGFSTRQGPLAVMLADHDEGREYISKMERANEEYSSGDQSATGGIVENARGYIYLLRNHIEKEDRVLYPMAVDALGERGINMMQQDFVKVEHDKEGVEQKYTALLKELESY